MRCDFRLNRLGRAAAIGLLALTAMSHWPTRVGAVEQAETIVADWPEPSRQTVLAMIETYGQPDLRDANSVAWLGLYRARKTAVHRSNSADGMIEQTVYYRVPAEKVAEVTSFDPRITVDRRASEMTVRSESVRTNFLALNLAHEVASGFKTVEEARAFRDRQIQLAEAGKSSRYRDRLIFEEPLKTPPNRFISPAGMIPPARNQP